MKKLQKRTRTRKQRQPNSAMNPGRFRNVGISAHVDSGKTTLTERILFYAGRIHRTREVRGGDGGPTTDFNPIEKRRGITISSAATQVSWNDHRVNLIDTPGHVDFTVEVERSLRVLDGAVLVLCASRGVQSQTITVDQQMSRYAVPRVAFVNKMDRIGANFDSVVDQMSRQLQTEAIPIQIPIGSESAFTGVIDLVTLQAISFVGQQGEVVELNPVPDDLIQQAQQARHCMLESLAMHDDSLMQQLVVGPTPSPDAIKAAIRRATLARKVTPVLAGSAFKDKGVQPLLDAMVDYLPSPLDADRVVDLNGALFSLSCDAVQPAVGLVFKTLVEKFGLVAFLRIYQGTITRGQSYFNVRRGKRVRVGRLVRIHANQYEDIELAEAGDIVGMIGAECYSGDTLNNGADAFELQPFEIAEPVVHLAIAAVDRNDNGKLAVALDRYKKEDPTFRVVTDPDSGETLIAGMGQLHLQVYVERLETEYDCQCVVGSPSVTYQERPSKVVSFTHQFRKQSGGPGQFAKLIGRVEPLPPDAAKEFEFVNEVSGGRIERKFIAAVERGVLDSIESGPLGGYPVVGVRFVLEDGEQHSNDSSEVAFRNCARQAMKEVVFPRLQLQLWEPMMQLEIECATEFQGAVSSQLARARGTVTGSSYSDLGCRLAAEAPLAELFNYSDELRSVTQGTGVFNMTPIGYQPTPARIQQEISGRS
ncbi:MAG: elongation factor G [Planctomycetota bacterium]